jgi:hypothetical protein
MSRALASPPPHPSLRSIPLFSETTNTDARLNALRDGGTFPHSSRVIAGSQCHGEVATRFDTWPTRVHWRRSAPTQEKIVYGIAPSMKDVPRRLWELARRN